MENNATLSLSAGDLGGSVAAGASLSARVANVLLKKIQAADLSPGTRLPTENAMAQHFGVSRTVIREAIASLKAEGIVETRQGSGAFVSRPVVESGFQVDPLTRDSVHKLLELIEVRRSTDSEIAALAAARRDAHQLEVIRHMLAQVDEAVVAGRNGVEEDLAFHLALARATGNPYWVKLMEMFSQQVRAAITVTRANEARRADFAQDVRLEHERIVAAIAAGDADAARSAAAHHMECAAKRVASADQEFWVREGGEYARRLAQD